jgi:hypothetical protein
VRRWPPSARNRAHASRSKLAGARQRGVRRRPQEVGTVKIQHFPKMLQHLAKC